VVLYDGENANGVECGRKPLAKTRAAVRAAAVARKRIGFMRRKVKSPYRVKVEVQKTGRLPAG
jgi:hypothetical protein